jgi:hypothetical protein
MYFRNNVSQSSILILLALTICFNLSAMEKPVEQTCHVKHATLIGRDSIQMQKIETPSVTMYNYNSDDFTDGDRNASFLKKVKNALHRSFFYGICNIGTSLLVGLANTGLNYLVFSRINSQKVNESSVTLEQLYLEAQLIKAYEQQNQHLSANENDQQNQEFQKRLGEAKKIYSDHITEYFKQNQKDAESENKTTSLPTGIPAAA